MAILNKIIDGLVGVPSMRRTRNFRMEAIKNMYDPTVYNEIATRQRTRAIEGLSDLVEQQALRRVADQMNRPIDYSMTGGNAARGMAMSNMQQTQGNRAYSQMAAQLAQMDEEIRNQYGDAYTQTVAQQSALMGQRRAGLANEQAAFNEERSMRRMSLGANVLQTGLSLAAPLVGGAIGGIIGKARASSAAKSAIANRPIEPVEPVVNVIPEAGMPNLSFSAPDYDSMRMDLPPGPLMTPAFQTPPRRQETNFIDVTQPNWWAKPIKGLRGGTPQGNRFMQAPGILPLNYY